jgi:hypothetical protein
MNNFQESKFIEGDEGSRKVVDMDGLDDDRAIGGPN